jgi:hypothetical protein
MPGFACNVMKRDMREPCMHTQMRLHNIEAPLQNSSAHVRLGAVAH